MTVPGFESRLVDAPADIIGKPLVLLHWAGATERVTLTDKSEAADWLVNGWTRYKMEGN